MQPWTSSGGLNEQQTDPAPILTYHCSRITFALVSFSDPRTRFAFQLGCLLMNFNVKRGEAFRYIADAGRC